MPVLLLCLAVLVAPGPAEAPDEIATLEAELATQPNNLDLMVQLAHAYARGGERTKARDLSERVIAKAPDYWDAHLVLARIDAWERRFERSLERLNTLLKEVPFLWEAKALKADVELWSGALVDARDTLLELLDRAETAELHFRLAQVEYERMHYWAAWQEATRALELDPLHARARALQEEITLVRAEVAVEFEYLPVPGATFAEAQLISVTLLPSAFLSLTVVEELRYRFGAFNQFLLGQVDYRLNRRVRIGGLAGFGAPAPAISKSAASGWLGVEILAPLDARLSYRYDRIGLPGDLHRISLDAGLLLPLSFRAELGYTLALVSPEEPELNVLHGLRARLGLEPPHFGAFVEYSFGSQVDRPVVGLTELDTHDFSLGFRYPANRWLEILAGLGLQLRRSEIASGEAFRGGLGLRLSL